MSAVSRLPHYEMTRFVGEIVDPSPVAQRDVLIGEERRPIDVYERYDLPAGTTLRGPIIIQEAGSTIWVAPEMDCVVDGAGNLVIHTSGLVPVASNSGGI